MSRAVRVTVDVPYCLLCPYHGNTVADKKYRCAKVEPERYLTYEDEFVRVPDWCPFRKVDIGDIEDIAERLEYPEKWDTAAYPTLADALTEIIKWSDTGDAE